MKGKGGYDWGQITEEKVIDLTAKQWSHLMTLVEAKWARKPSAQLGVEHQATLEDLMSGLDGESWILEVKDKTSYTFEDLANPRTVNENKEAWGKLINKSLSPKDRRNIGLDPFVSVCEYLLKLSGFKMKPM